MWRKDSTSATTEDAMIYARPSLPCSTPCLEVPTPTPPTPLPTSIGSVLVFSARCNIYISRLCYDVSVSLSVTEVHWRIIANLGFKLDPTLPRIAATVLLAGAVLLAVQLAGGHLESSARLFCFTVRHAISMYSHL